MNVLRWARRALLLFIVTYLGSLAAAALADYPSSGDVAFLAGTMSMVGIVIASFIAVAAQLALLVWRSTGKGATNG